MNRRFLIALAVLPLLASTTTVSAQPIDIRLIGITGKQNSGESGVDPNDDKLFEISLTDASLTPLIKLDFVPDTTAIGFNPENGLLYRTAGSESYRNDPNKIAYNDNQYMQTVDVYTAGFPQAGVFNANHQGDAGFGPYGLPAPRPNFILPAERRTDEQTDPSFQQRGPNEYHALRDFTWSSTEHLFYGADERGIFRLTATGESTFVGFPGGVDGPKGISFFTVEGQRRLLVSERDGPLLVSIDPQTAQPIGNPVVMVDPAQALLEGVLSLVEHPNGTELYGITKSPAGRYLIRINPVTGATTWIGVLAPPGGAEFADLAFVYRNAGPVIHTWNVDADGNWSVATNWTNGEPNGAGTVASFLGVITAPHTVNIDGPKSVGELRFDNANSYTLGGPGPLTISNTAGASIVVQNGSHTISAPLSIAAGNTVTKSGPGTLTISGAQSHAPGAVLIASAGVTNLNSDGGQNLSVQANASVNFGSTQHLNNLSIGAGAKATLTAGGNKVLVSNVPTIAGATGAWTGTLDLTDNDAAFQSSAANKIADFNRLYDQLKSGYAAAAWNGTGINSSTAAADANFETGLVMIDNEVFGYTDFSGQTVDANSILLKYTYYGDIDANGEVNADDLTIFANNFGKATGAGQVDGDIDFDADVNADDLTIFANNFGKGVGAPLASGAVEAVPEPAGLALAGIAALFALAGIYMQRRRFRADASRR
jgi:hypothetical protein